MAKTSVRVFFKSLQKDDKKTIAKLEIRGNVTDEQMMELMNLAGGIVDVDFITPQTDIDDYKPTPKGITYAVNEDGIADVDGEQMEIDEALAAANAEAIASYEQADILAQHEAAFDEVAVASEELPFTPDELDDLLNE